MTSPEAEGSPEDGGRTRRIGGLLVVLGVGLAWWWLAGSDLAGQTGRLAAQGPDPGTSSAIYLPFTLRGTLSAAIREAATARAATATARAGTAQASTPSATPTEHAVGGSPTPTVGVTATTGPVATLSPVVTASPTATLTPSAVPTITPSATLGSPQPTPTRTPTPTPRDPAAERLLPLGAQRSAETRVTYDARTQTYRLTSRGAVTLTYEIDLTHPDNSRGRLAIREVTSGRYPVAGAGLYYRRRDGALIEPRLFSLIGTVTAVEHEALPTGVRITVRERLQDADHSKRYIVTLVGRSLEWHAESLDPTGPAAGAYAGITAGDVEGTADGVGIRIPYMDAVPVTMLDHRWFASTLLEYPRSHASALVPRGPEAVPGAFTNEVTAIYEPDTQGRVDPIDETVWITLSPQVEDTFAVPTNAPPPFPGGLSDYVHVTLMGRAPAVTFADEVAYIGRIMGWSTRGPLHGIAFHKRYWRDPAVPAPVQLPPDPAAGGEAGFATLSDVTGHQMASTIGLTTTVASCPHHPNRLYRPQDRVVDSEGEYKRAEADFACPDGTSVATYLLPPDAAQRIVLQEKDAWHAARIPAVDVDLMSAWNPAYAWLGATQNVLDRAAQTAHPTTIGATILAYKRLFATLQEEIGPVFGRGGTGAWELGYDSFYVGYLDGVARALSTGSTDEQPGSAYLVVPDYELTLVRPRMTSYGMGSYEQFFGTPSRPLSDAELDEWRVTELAYGHAGAWTVQAQPGVPEEVTDAEQAKEYYLVRTLARRYLDPSQTPTVSIGYAGADGLDRDLSYALAHDFDLAEPRLHLRYGGALELWINHSRNVWTVSSGGESYLLPQHGWLARGTGLLGFSALVDGRQADFLRVPEVTVLDGRGRVTYFDAQSARDLKVIFPDGQVLEELPDGTLGWTTP